MLLPLLLVSWIIAAPQSAPGPGAPLRDPTKHLSQFVLKSWSMDDGLPQNSVQVVRQDAAGYLWLGTEEGLVRFNGSDFVVFDRSNTDAFGGSQNVLAIAEDDLGTLWIGTHGGGLIRHNTGGFDALEPSDVPAGAQVGALLPVGPDMWVGTWNSGLLRCTPTGCRPVALDGGDPVGPIHALASNRAQAIFIGLDDGLLRLEDNHFERIGSLDGFHVQSLFVDRDDQLWVGTSAGLFLVTEGGIRKLDPSEGWPDETVWSMMQDSTGSMWFGLDMRGLLRMGSLGADRLTGANGLPGNRVMSMIQDLEGNVWIGTAFGGLIRLRDGAFTTYGVAEGLTSPTASTIFEDPDGTVWLGTLGGGVHRIRGALPGRYAALPVEPFGGTLADAAVTAITGTPDGAVWIGTVDGGLTRYGREGSRRIGAADGLASDAVYALYTSRNGEVWVGTDQGLSVLRNGKIDTYTTRDGLSANSVTAVIDSPDGSVWIGTYDGGLNRMTTSGVEVYTTEAGLGSNTISALHIDSDRNLWVGTNGGGISVYRDGRFVTVTTRDGLFSDQVFQILEDESGSLWMGSNQGVFRIDKVELLERMDGKRADLSFERFGREDGMRSPEVFGGVQPAGWKGRDGRLWFPTAHGVTVVDPTHLNRNVVPPPVIIEQVIVDSQASEAGGSLQLPPDAVRIEFRFVALSLVNDQAVRYRYLLEGDDDEWSSPSPQRSATYTHLSPGKYSFRVMASNNDGLWNETGASVTFEVLPNVFETWWFWLGSILLLVSLLTIGYSLRIRNLKEQERRLERMVTARTKDALDAKECIEAQSDALRRSLREKDVLLREIHHRVKNNLQMISSLLQLSAKQVADPRTKLLFAECRDRIYSISMVHERLYRSRDLANVDFGEYLESITQQLIRSHNLADGRVKVIVEVTAIRLETNQAIPCGLIVTELVSNALKHAYKREDTGEIHVRMSAEGSMCRLVVEDDGRGVPKDFQSRRESSLGLNLVDALVHRLQGTVGMIADSKSGMQGTRFEIDFPLGVQNHPDLFDGAAGDTMMPSSYVTRLQEEVAQAELAAKEPA